ARAKGSGGYVNELLGAGSRARLKGGRRGEGVDAAARAARATPQPPATYQRATGRPATPFVVNMGLHAGSALVGVTRFAGPYGERWTYTASGPVINTAARLCALARDGAILLSDVAATCLAAAYLLHPLGAHHLKN